MRRIRTAVLISGRGSNLTSLMRAAQAPDYPAEIVLVVSNRPEAPGLERARSEGVEAVCVDHRPYGKDRAAHEAAIDTALRGRGVELVALAGYMRILSPFLTSKWSGRMINIHPSLLPLYPGLDTHARALQAGDRDAGCTVHLVTETVDAGPILGQRRVPILPGDDADRLAARVLEAEHVLYPACLGDFARRLTGDAPSPS